MTKRSRMRRTTTKKLPRMLLNCGDPGYGGGEDDENDENDDDWDDGEDEDDDTPPFTYLPMKN